LNIFHSAALMQFQMMWPVRNLASTLDMQVS